MTLVEVVLYVEDVALSLAFLERATGLRVLSRSPELSVLAAGPLRLALRPLPLATLGHDGRPLGPVPPMAAAELVWEVDDVAVASREAGEMGAHVLTPAVALPYGEVATVAAPGGVRITYFRRR